MRRSRGIFLVPIILLLFAVNGFGAEVLTNEAIVTMVKAGLGQELIISKIKISQGQYDLSTNGLVKLKSDGVSEKIIQAMLGASAKPEPPGAGAAPAETRPAPSAEKQQEAIALYRQGKAAEAASAFDALLAEAPNDDGLKIWKALALLEQARASRESRASGYKPLVVRAYAILRPLSRTQAENTDWLFAMARAFWLNDRPERASRVAKRVLAARPNSAETYLLLGDLTFDEALAPPAGGPPDAGVTWRRGLASRKEYEAALGLPDVLPALRAEAFYKLGLVSAELENKKEVAREYWEKAVAADPVSRYGDMAQQKLKAVPPK